MEELLIIFRALADPTRLRIMLLLLEMELAVGELATLLGQSQPRISRHIRILDEAGLAERHKEGSWVFLRPGAGRDVETLARLLRAEKMASDEQTLADRARLVAVRQARAEQAERYFASHAESWDAIRSMHVAEPEVEAAMRRVLEDRPLGQMLDVGTGTGRMIELFGPAADTVTAVDKSPEMLRLARSKLLGDDLQKASRRALANKTRLKLDDFNALTLDNASFDSVILHQVLHYAQNPERVIPEIARVIRPGGLMLIVDFAQHDHEELRSEHAHARLGFSDENIARWFNDAQVKLDHVETLEGGALTVKLWLGAKMEASVKSATVTPISSLKRAV
ncbi:MAG: metalloregulator ArsR/SmtB family transcription factor [Parasphingorhabdus sp.]|nr:metalloregulator ArsR/SmtB family transcription factor [Parasphingorhabdus sp.]